MYPIRRLPQRNLFAFFHACKDVLYRKGVQTATTLVPLSEDIFLKFYLEIQVAQSLSQNK